MVSNSHEKLKLDFGLAITCISDHSATKKSVKLITNKALLSKIPYFKAMMSDESNWKEHNKNQIEISTPFDAFLTKNYIDIKVRYVLHTNSKIENVLKSKFVVKLRNKSKTGEMIDEKMIETQVSSKVNQNMLSFKRIADFFGDVETVEEIKDSLVAYYQRHCGPEALIEFWALTDTLNDGGTDAFVQDFCRTEIKKFKRRVDTSTVPNKQVADNKNSIDFGSFCRTQMQLSRKLLPNARIFNEFCDVFNESQKSIFSLEQKRANFLRIIWLTTKFEGKLPQGSDFDDVFFKIKFSQVSDQLKMKLQCLLIENRKPIAKYAEFMAESKKEHKGPVNNNLMLIALNNYEDQVKREERKIWEAARTKKAKRPILARWDLDERFEELSINSSNDEF